MKICGKCKRELPMNTDYFFKKRDTKDGFVNRCKECQDYEFTNKLTKIPKENHKFCIKCDRELPINIKYFPPDKMCKDGLRNVCRECGNDGHFMDDDYTPKKWWTEEENRLFIERYPHYLNSELIEIFYNKETEKRLQDKAYLLNVSKSDETRERRYKIHSEKMSGVDSPLYNYPRSKETREKISKARKGKFSGEKSYWFGKKRSLDQRSYLSKIKKESGNWKGNKNPRHLNPLIKENNGMWKGGISELHVHLRRFIKPWKDDSMKDCNYKCIITGGEFDNIHHLYNFSYILEETMRIVDLPVYEQINKYSVEEMKSIEDTCLKLHYDLGLGVCLRKDIHKLFHDLYGYSKNTPDQFEEFKLRYKMGEFNELNSKVGEKIG